MNKSVLVCLIFSLLSLCASSGCVSYTTLQSANTIETGKVLVGLGSAMVSTDKGVGYMPEANARIGVAQNFDIGAKYSIPATAFIDGKYQIIREPLAVSFDLGWSYFSYSAANGKSSGKTTGWYPAILAGQEHWYVGVKRVYISTETEFEFFGLNKFSSSGWLGTHLVAGVIIGNSFRLIPEVNYIIPVTGKGLLVPAVGIQLIY